MIARNEAEAEQEETEQEGTEAEPDPEPPAPPPSEPAPEPAEPQPVDVVERDKKLTAEETRHENQLKKIYGDDFALRARCGVCDGEGYVEPTAELLVQLVQLGEAAQVQLGEAGKDLRTPEEFIVCERCGGHGEVRTTAKNDHNAVIPCKLCDARGYFDTTDPIHRGRLNLDPAPAPVASQPAFATYHAPTPQVNGEVLQPPQGWHEGGMQGADLWSRWPGHPRFGIDPAVGGW